MRYLILLVVLFSCAKEELTIKRKKYCNPMNISSSIPVQFWVNGEETYNESQPICGLEPACFCQPFNCDDEIAIQASETAGSIVSLVIYDDSSNEITTLEFDEVQSGVFKIEFIPSELSPEICNQKIKLVISSQKYTNIISNPTFDGSTGWQNSNLSLADWSVVSGEATVVLGSLVSSEYYYQSQSGVAGTYRVRIKARLTESGGTDSSVSIYLELFSGGISGSSVSFELLCSLFTSPLNTFDGEIEITVPSDFDTITLSASQAGPAAATATVFVDYYYLDLISNETATSDCIDLRNSHECSKLITYTNSSDFDGIKYAGVSPQPTFYLRVPAQLLEDENPQTQEDLELSNGEIVTIRQTIQEKSVLKVGFMPPYMHTKLQKVLMHDTVIIDGIQWKRRDPYEAPRIKDYPLKKGEVLLTKYNSVLKNTI